jgi:hypothetical protein
VSSLPTPSESLPVPFELMLTPYEPEPQPRTQPKEPPKADPSPFSFFAEKTAATSPNSTQPIPRGPSQIIHQRSAMSEQVRPLEGYGTRALVLGLVRLLQRRSILGQDELQHFINTLAEAREIDPDK